MQTTNTTSSPAQNPVKNDWEFAEVWVDSMLSPPYVLLLLSINGNYRIYDSVQGYKIVFSSNSYDEAQLWLLEDEYEPIEGRLLASELP